MHIKGVIGLGSMNDPFMPLEAEINLAGRAYERAYGERYGCNAPRSAQLYATFEKLCAAHGLATRMPLYAPQTVEQLSLF